MTQTITTDTNHDAITARVVAEQITISNGARLTIDSMPQHTTMGPLGKLLIDSGALLIDGRYVRETAYTSGSGALPAVGAAVSWGSGGTAGTGKVIQLTSGDNTAGVMTITKQTGENPNGTITDGTWSATVSTDKVGYLKVFIQENTGGPASSTGDATFYIHGDWYELGVGDGTDSQSFTLPHAGVQAGIWVETGNGTGVFELWHRIWNGDGTNADYFDQLSDWGTTFESGKVFAQTALTSTVTFGTSAYGGVPPNGARLRIPNVHIGAVDQATSWYNEYFVFTDSAHSINFNACASVNVADHYWDHVNISTAYMSPRSLGASTFTDFCFPFITTTTWMDNCQSLVEFTNGVFGCCGYNSTGQCPPSQAYLSDNSGTVKFTDTVWAGARTEILEISTSAHIYFYGTTKMVLLEDKFTSTYALKINNTLDIYAEKLILLNGGLTMANAIDFVIDELIIGVLSSKQTVTDSGYSCYITGIASAGIIKKFRFPDGATKPIKGTIHHILDASGGIKLRNVGELTNKLDCAARAGGLVYLSGAASNIDVRRAWVTNTTSTQGIVGSLSSSDATFINVGTDYDDELEMDMSRETIRGVHIASGGPGSATGVEDDLINIVGTCFYDIFTSDTTGAIGLVFNAPGQKHANHVTKTAGTPVFNSIGDLLMRTTGDQVEYVWPWIIKGHTALQNAAYLTAGVSVANIDVEYAVDTGSGYGAWKAATGANLSGETVDATGFFIKFRFTANTTASNTSIRGFQILTNTTLAAQAANFYPLDEITLTLTGVVVGSDVVILPAGGESPLLSVDATATSTVDFTYETTQNVDITVYKAGYIPFAIRNYPLSSSAASLPIAQRPDRNYVD